MGDATSQDPKLVDFFEVVSSYFVDVIYNSVYQIARKSHHEGKAASVVDAYRASVQAYITHHKSTPSAYQRTLTDLTERIKAEPEHAHKTPAQVAEVLTEALVPDDIFTTMRDKERDEVACTAVVDLIAAIGVLATSPGRISGITAPGLRGTEGVVALQNHAVASLFATRERLHNKFLGVMAQAKEEVSLAHVNKLMVAIRTLAARKAESDAATAAAEERADAARDEAKAIKKQYMALHAEAQGALKKCGERIQELEREARGMRAALERRGGSPPEGPAASPLPLLEALAASPPQEAPAASPPQEASYPPQEASPLPPQESFASSRETAAGPTIEESAEAEFENFFTTTPM